MADPTPTTCSTTACEYWPAPDGGCCKAYERDPAANLAPNQSTELPTVAQRQVGRAWLQLYGHMVADDPAFVAAALWRCMWRARYEPEAMEIQHLFREAVTNA